MIAYNNQKAWTLSLKNLYTPTHFPPTPRVRNRWHPENGNKCLLISCYLPKDHVAHAKACVALGTLPTEYPHNLIILGGEF